MGLGFSSRWCKWTSSWRSRYMYSTYNAKQLAVSRHQRISCSREQHQRIVAGGFHRVPFLSVPTALLSRKTYARCCKREHNVDTDWNGKECATTDSCNVLVLMPIFSLGHDSVSRRCSDLPCVCSLVAPHVDDEQEESKE